MNKEKNSRIAVVFIYASAALYFTSLWLPVTECGQGYDAGARLVLFGFLSVLEGPLPFMLWLSNIIYIVAIIQFLSGKKSDLGRDLALLNTAFLVAALFLPVEDAIELDAWLGRPKECHFSYGYYFWIASYALLTISIAISFFGNNDEPHTWKYK